MSDLFLSRIRLSDFRVYGDHYTFDLDPRPGVTLIVGVNGVVRRRCSTASNGR